MCAPIRETLIHSKPVGAPPSGAMGVPTIAPEDGAPTLPVRFIMISMADKSELP